MVTRGTSANVVALTFDSRGAETGTTTSVLDTLKTYGFKATFFVVGEWAEKNPELLRRMAAEGHELANHTYYHPNLTEAAPERIRLEVSVAEEAIQRAAGVPSKKMLRPPYGANDQTVRVVLGELGYDVILWSLDSGDWRKLSAAEIVERFSKGTRAGDIVIFHTYAENTDEAIKGVCESLKQRKLRGGTVSQALGR